MDGGSNKKFWELILGIFVFIFCLIILLASVLKTEEPIPTLQHQDIIKDTFEVVEEKSEEKYDYKIDEDSIENDDISIPSDYEDTIVEFNGFSVQFKSY